MIVFQGTLRRLNRNIILFSTATIYSIEQEKSSKIRAHEQSWRGNLTASFTIRTHRKQVAGGDWEADGEGRRPLDAGRVVLVGSGGEDHQHKHEGDQELNAEGLDFVS